jgi:HEAT repeat protein
MEVAMDADTPYSQAQTLESLVDKLNATIESDNPFAAQYARAEAARELGRLGDPAAVPALVAALSDPNYLCVSAALALAQIGDPRAIEPLGAVLEDQNKFWVPRGAAAVALGMFGGAARPAVAALERALEYDVAESGEHWDVRARQAVEDALTHIADPTQACALTGKGYRFEMWGIY